MQPLRASRLAELGLAAVLCAALSPPAAAQTGRLGKEWFVDRHNGYRLRVPDEWLAVPVQPGEAEQGIVAQMNGPVFAVRVVNQSRNVQARLRILKFEPPEVVTDSGATSGGLRGRIDASSGRPTIEETMKAAAEGWGLRDFAARTPEDVKLGAFTPKHQAFTGKVAGLVPVLFDTWTFRLDDFDITLVYEIPLEHATKWERVFRDSARSFELVARSAAAGLADEGDYEQLLAYHRDEVARTKGWRLLEVPSKRYLLKTSSQDEGFLSELVQRLEDSRNLFERDFPPSKLISHTSVVRVCSSLEEFHTYGKTGGGVAGWFNPATTELVTADFKEYDRNFTFGVITHEAFHQYCHFLFDQSEAHRWFDEGHGDYYGAFLFKNGKPIPRANMRGETRLVGIREQIRENTYTPISRHVRQNHPEWQSKGVASYEQSWSIIYMLRRGMEGEVPRKVWRPEYGRIIPEYVRVLYEEFQKAYEELREQKRKAAEAEGKELKPEDLETKNLALTEARKEKIWEKAIAASWGQVNEMEFEEHWKEYVLHHLKD